MRHITLIIAVVALAIAAPAIAGKGGNGNGNAGGNGNGNAGAGGGSDSRTGTISLNQGSPSLGSTVTFTTSYTNNVNPRVDVVCYQGGVLVYGEGGSPEHAFLLGGASSDWLRAGGSASCEARLWDLIWNGNNAQEWVQLGSTSFDAAG